ncbi:hypothetical protein BFJ63_vAg18832, partial [Fusarium oxysporum f. sp. narcissi]
PRGGVGRQAVCPRAAPPGADPGGRPVAAGDAQTVYSLRARQVCRAPNECALPAAAAYRRGRRHLPAQACRVLGRMAGVGACGAAGTVRDAFKTSQLIQLSVSVLTANEKIKFATIVDVKPEDA